MGGERQTCVDCASNSPEADTDYTLINARHGEASTDVHAGGGVRRGVLMPPFWRKFKATNGIAGVVAARSSRRDQRTRQRIFARSSRRMRGRSSETAAWE